MIDIRVLVRVWLVLLFHLCPVLLATVVPIAVDDHPMMKMGSDPTLRPELVDHMKPNLKWANTRLTYEIKDGEIACFYQKFDGSRKFTFFVEVLKGGNLDIGLYVTSPNGKKLLSLPRTTKRSLTFETSYGVYEFCLSNKFSAVTHKLVYLELKSERRYVIGRVDQDPDKSPRVETYVQSLSDNIYTYMSKVTEMQNSYRLREVTAFFQAENLAYKVMLWSFVVTLAIFIVGVGQLIVVRLLFSTNRKAGI